MNKRKRAESYREKKRKTESIGRKIRNTNRKRKLEEGLRDGDREHTDTGGRRDRR